MTERRPAWPHLSDNVRGALWLLFSSLAFSGMNATIKALGAAGYHSFQIVFLRSLMGLVVLLPFMLQGGASLAMRRPALHLLRALLGLAAMYATFTALTRLPLADAVALFFTKPLFMIVLAALFLGERLRWRRSLATAVGFGGVLIMLRPGSGNWDWTALLAILAALLMGVVMVVVKKMTASERPLTMVFYFSLLTAIGGLAPALMVWRWPDAAAWGWIAAMGVSGSIGQYLAVRAYRVGEATAVTPMDYSQMLFAGAIGFLLFGEVPDGWTVVGGVVIAGASLYLMRREARLRRLATAPESR